MLSAIVYGRNDGFNYELNRRTALGLNQLAWQLKSGRDEIVFVDYNTEDDLPTLPEAIADTLTGRAIALTRVIRVRPGFHTRQTSPGPPVREAICRNIAIRRLADDTKLVLSTNPDCLLISEKSRPLCSALDQLPDGYFGLPRFELPRFLWEQLPRSNPIETEKLLRRWSPSLALEEEVRHYLPAVGFDAPGDFQLVRRADLLRVSGFSERMSFGWHVDSNLNARLAKIYGQLTPFNSVTGIDFKLFHAEHGRRATSKHSSGREEDSFEDYVEQIATAGIGHEQPEWGYPSETFEEFELAKPPARRILNQLTDQVSHAPASYVYGSESFDLLPRSPVHSMAFLIDHLAYLSPDCPIGWFSEDQVDAAAFKTFLKRIGLTNPVYLAWTSEQIAEVIAHAELFIVDAPQGPRNSGAVVSETAIAAIVRAEHDRFRENLPARRIIGLNVPHSRFEGPFLSVIPAVLTPVATRIRFGTVAPPQLQEVDLLSDHLEFSGDKEKSGDGYVAICRLCNLPPNDWHLDYCVKVGMNLTGRAVLDVAIDGKPVAETVLQIGLGGRRTGRLSFSSGADGLFGGGLECRLWSGKSTKAELISAKLIPVPREKGD